MIRPMTPQMAVTTARQMYQMMYGLDIDERMFVEMVAPEIYGAAKMENKAGQQFIDYFARVDVEADEVLKEYASRYAEPSKSTTQTPIQPESQQLEVPRVVLATEADLEALL